MTSVPNSGVSRLRLETLHVWRKLTGQRRRAQVAAKRAFDAALARLGSDDIAIDLGANVGEFTAKMAATGARVYAFEPDPHAFALLQKAVGGRANVTLFQAAAGVEDSTATLYRAAGFESERNRDRASKSSSLFVEKRNVAADNAVSIEVRDFPAFLRGLDHPIALIKIDIEGGEVPLMERLLSCDPALPIGEIYVETHERKLPHMAARTATLKHATAARTAPRVNWDWH